MRFVTRLGHQDDVLIGDAHEGELTPLFQSEWERCLQHDTTFVDIGAHVGHWTVRAALFGVSVVAIEPQPDVRDALKENLRVNNVHDQVQVLPYAAWSRDSMLFLDVPTREESFNQSYHVYSGTPVSASGSVTVVRRPTQIHVAAYTLDRMQQQFIPFVPGFVKIDVEGSEGHVIVGMEMILRTYRPRLLVEMHDCYYGPEVAAQVVDRVEKADYKWSAIRTNAPHWYLHAIPN